MKKEEIIKSLIAGSFVSGCGNVIKNMMSESGYSVTSQTPVACVDLDKLAKFLAKYVVKENLIED